MVHDDLGQEVNDARFVVSVLNREEKGSDVNVAAHLLLDVMRGHVDAAVVISNDSDLELPLRWAREQAPVGLMNPARSSWPASCAEAQPRAWEATGGSA